MSEMHHVFFSNDRVILQHPPVTPFYSRYPWKISSGFSPMSYSSVSVVLSEGTPKFAVQEADVPKKEKWKTKKRLKMQRMREKRKRKLASKQDPRRFTVKARKQRLPNAEARIKNKIEKVKDIFFLTSFFTTCDNCVSAWIFNCLLLHLSEFNVESLFNFAVFNYNFS